jgi:hypothetical protein
MHQQDLGTYQMLWDCPACGTSKLLGIDHRHCPACGSPQDPNYRYYPSDADKILVQNHAYVGADRVCPGCSTANSAASSFCAGCGAPLERDAREAAARTDQLAGQGMAFGGETVAAARAEIQQRRQMQMHAAGVQHRAQPKKSSGRKILFIVLAVIAALGVLLWVLFFWKKDVGVEVEGHAWKREIVVEKFGPQRDSVWCDEMPKGAYDVSRRPDVRSQKKVADGQDCKTRRKDNRDGTFKEVKECTTKYRNEPVYSDKCTFMIDRWAAARTEKAEGSSKDPAPSWPAVALTKPGTCKGCEREGARTGTYTLRFVDPKTKEQYQCDVPETQWNAAAVGSRFVAKVGVVSSKLDCDSFAPAP